MEDDPIIEEPPSERDENPAASEHSSTDSGEEAGKSRKKNRRT